MKKWTEYFKEMGFIVRELMPMKRIYVNEAVCIGCRLCEVYCRTAHSKSKDVIKAYKKESPQAVARLRVESKAPVSFSLQCRQCDEPACLFACLTGALQRNEDGLVVVDTEKCVGCWTCVLVCPFGAIRRDTQARKIAKCDLCIGNDMPACVSNCPNEALIYA